MWSGRRTIDDSNTTLAQRDHQLICALDVDRLDAHAANLGRHGQFSGIEFLPSQTCRRRRCCLPPIQDIRTAEGRLAKLRRGIANCPYGQ
jgi:hypothetical protein